jgi:hypothetical protein
MNNNNKGVDVMIYWNNAKLPLPIIPTFHHSITPLASQSDALFMDYLGGIYYESY